MLTLRILKPQNNDIRAKHVSANIPNAVFYIPFGYYYAVRLGTLPKLLSWMLIYIMPTAFYSFMTYEGAVLPFVVNYLLVLLAVFSLYELGYILNDTVAIRHEKQPAIRLYEHNFEHFGYYKRAIIAARIGYAIIATGTLIAINAQNTTIISRNLWLTCACIAAILPIFIIYNCWRNKYNVWLYPVLVFSRYLPFMLMYRIDGWAIMMLFLSFPFANMLERFSMPLHRFPVMRQLIPTEESKTIFRPFYYLAILWVPLLLPIPINAAYIYMFPPVILFFYRLTLYFIVKRHHLTNYLNG